jgi:enoyl-[acyl-carrier protein] reductase III
MRNHCISTHGRSTNLQKKSTASETATEPLSCVLHGKVALITGGARGIGRATALKLAAAGCDIAIDYYSSHEEAESLAAEICETGRRAVIYQANIADPAGVKELFDALLGDFEHLDIIISNAATGVLRPVMEMRLKHWRWCMEANAFALTQLAQLAVPVMPDGGRIIALSSLGANRAVPGYGFVGASKAALESLVRSLAQELGPQGITVNTVSAGAVDTDALAYFPNREQLLAEFASRTPAGPVLTPEDVANAIYLLCLPEARMITGHTLFVDGGFSISG